MPKPWLLAEQTYHDIKQAAIEVAVLPFGATEPHNLHLPYSTDVIEADSFADASCERAHRRGAKVICLPTIPYGTETNQHTFPLSMNLQPSTLLAILRDLVESLERSGVKKCLILNSHGGNEFKGHLRELFGHTGVHLFLCNWYTMCREQYREIFTHADDHAGEMETSLILSLHPDLVRLENADDGAVRQCRFAAVREGWVQLTRPWHLLTTNSGAGNPKLATADKGRRWFDLVTDRITDFLVELSDAPVDESFPF